MTPPIVSHHLLLCAAPTKASGSCIGRGQGDASWNILKQLVKDLRLDSPDRPQGIVLRTKADCLRVCFHGPILLIWPDGIWYDRATPDRITRIIHEHVIGGEPCQDWVIRRSPFSSI